MMNFKVKRIIASLISILPLNLNRGLLYKSILGYSISNCKIGWGTVISVDKFTAKNSIIGRSNKFIGPITVTIGENTSIGKKNIFECGVWVLQNQHKTHLYRRELVIGNNCLINNNHYFDIVDKFELGDNSWIAGESSQVWTHGAGKQDGAVSIGTQCYIGSAVKFAPSSKVGNNCIVGLGSVVTKKFDDEYCIIAGNPSKIIKNNYDWAKN